MSIEHLVNVQKGHVKSPKKRCFDDNDNEIIFTPSPSPGNLALQDQPRGIHGIPPYMLNHIQRFMGPETTRGYMRPRTFAMLPQPSLGRMMFDFLYPGGEPRIKKNYLRHLRDNFERNHNAILIYKIKMFDLFEDYVRQTYIANQFKPIPLTEDEKHMYRFKLNKMIEVFMVGVPNREEVLVYLEKEEYIDDGIPDYEPY